MRRSGIPLGIGALLLALAAGQAAAAETGVAAVDTAWRKAVIAGDLEAVMACYASDAVAWFPQDPEHRGQEAIRESYKNLFATFTVRDVDFVETHYRTLDGVAIGWGTYTMTLLPRAGGQPELVRGRFTEIAEKRGGRWVYVVDHDSTPPASPPRPNP